MKRPDTMSTPDNKPENKAETQTENAAGNAAGEESTEVTIKPAPDQTAEKTPGGVSLWINLTIYIGTIFFPLIGIAMGFTYLRKEDPEKKRAGRNWLILGVVILLINIALVSIMKRPDAG